MCFMPRNEAEFHRLFMSIIKRSSKNNTYKLALALFLIDYSCSPKSKPPYRVSYREIAEYFLKYYWSHVCKSKLRQGPKRQPPLIIKIIGEEFQDQVYPQTFDDLKKTELETIVQCANRIKKRCFKDVIPRFQWVNKNREVAFFWYLSKEYDDKARNARIDPDDEILVNPAAVEFFRKNCVSLRNSVILEWVRFLEVLNFGTPNLVRKIEADHKGPKNQRKFIQDLWPISNKCFYCEEDLLLDRNTHVDHVIPYDYIGDTEMWNLVLACRECNCVKLDRLPPKHYVKKLSKRNKEYRRIKSIRDSMEGALLGNYDLPDYTQNDADWMTDARTDWMMDARLDWHYKNASNHGYPVIRKFPCRNPSGAPA